VHERQIRAIMWIDIAVTVLLTLRLALFRPVLPQLVDPHNDTSPPEGEDDQEDLFVVVEKWAHVPLRDLTRKQ
jgi:hypothetical protein